MLVSQSPLTQDLSTDIHCSYAYLWWKLWILIFLAKRYAKIGIYFLYDQMRMDFNVFSSAHVDFKLWYIHWRIHIIYIDTRWQLHHLFLCWGGRQIFHHYTVNFLTARILSLPSLIYPVMFIRILCQSQHALIDRVFQWMTGWISEEEEKFFWQSRSSLKMRKFLYVCTHMYYVNTVVRK